MNKINLKKGIITSTLVVASLLLSISPVFATVFVPLTGQLDYGQTGTNVTNLQTFLASNPSIYPQGRITGYFGPLTKSAVMNYQNAYGIAQVGIVGPQTLASINGLIAQGSGPLGGTLASTIAPTIYTPSVSVSRNGAVMNFITNEPTVTQVYYSFTPFQIAEAQVGFQKPTINGGSVTAKTSSYQTIQGTNLQNLLSNTLYYYIVEATDSSGNVSVTWPSSFVTTN